LLCERLRIISHIYHTQKVLWKCCLIHTAPFYTVLPNVPFASKRGLQRPILPPCTYPFVSHVRVPGSLLPSPSRLPPGEFMAGLHPAVLLNTDNQNYNFLQFSQEFSRENYRAFLFRKLRRAWPGLSGIFCACALKLTADTEHGVATGPAAYRIDSVSRRAGRYLET
jgi:hypothetical protein